MDLRNRWEITHLLTYSDRWASHNKKTGTTCWGWFVYYPRRIRSGNKSHWLQQHIFWIWRKCPSFTQRVFKYRKQSHGFVEGWFFLNNADLFMKHLWLNSKHTTSSSLIVANYYFFNIRTAPHFSKHLSDWGSVISWFVLCIIFCHIYKFTDSNLSFQKPPSPFSGQFMLFLSPWTS